MTSSDIDTTFDRMFEELFSDEEFCREPDAKAEEYRK